MCRVENATIPNPTLPQPRSVPGIAFQVREVPRPELGSSAMWRNPGWYLADLRSCESPLTIDYSLPCNHAMITHTHLRERETPCHEPADRPKPNRFHRSMP